MIVLIRIWIYFFRHLYNLYWSRCCCTAWCLFRSLLCFPVTGISNLICPASSDHYLSPPLPKLHTYFRLPTCWWYIPSQWQLHVFGIYEPLPKNVSVTSGAVALTSGFRTPDPLKLLALANTGWGISRLTPLYPTNGMSYAPGSQYIVVMSRISCSFTPNHYILRARCVQQAVRGIKGC